MMSMENGNGDDDSGDDIHLPDSLPLLLWALQNGAAWPDMDKS
jgi:hypothetical protein